MPRKATSKDVADLAGVSRSAVSLVLNGRGAGNIAPDKQALIIEAARKLNYTPNTVALSLRSRRSATIGVVTDAIATSAFGGRLLQGAADAAVAEGYLLLVVETQNDAERERRAYDTLQNRQVDGFLFAAMSLRPYAPPPLDGAPRALANCYDPGGTAPAFIPDEVAGSRAVTRLLIEHGHRSIAMLTGTSDVVATGLREQGYADAMNSAGLPAVPPIAAGWDIDKGFAAATLALTSLEPRPTALFCVNDRAAVGAILAASRLGLSVPGDLSVVGYDDDENVAPFLVPALTTVRLPHREMGERAMRAVLESAADDRGPGEPAARRIVPGVDGATTSPVLLECPLVIRKSVAPPPV